MVAAVDDSVKDSCAAPWSRGVRVATDTSQWNLQEAGELILHRQLQGCGERWEIKLRDHSRRDKVRN